jgi:hypothetical protein
MVGLLRVGRASKCAWTTDAIRDGNEKPDVLADIGYYHILSTNFVNNQMLY